MKRGETLRRALLRWDRLLTATVLGLPFLAACLLGFLWLWEHGLFLWFILLSLAAGLLVWGLRHWLRRPAARAERPPGLEKLVVAADPAWDARERAVFTALREHIATLTAEALPWQTLDEQALGVVNEVARRLGGEGKTALHFTLPEALLLIEHSASRYRGYLRAHVPFADQVSLANLQWIWSQRQRATLAWKAAHGLHRAARFALNPGQGVLRELEQLVAGGNSSFLSREMLGVLQAVLLEEVAFAAIELYSGRLRFSEAELLQRQLDTTAGDRAQLARPDEPLRVLFVGQTSAGKSSLINALLQAELAETDAAATTAGQVGYAAELDGVPCLLIDTRGLDGSEARLKSLLDELTEADLVVWCLRANRPARGPDQVLKQRFEAWFEARPERRRPPVIVVATCIDCCTAGWPFPEHQLPAPVQQGFADALAAIAEDLPGWQAQPVCALPPEWNLEALTASLHAVLGEALMVQRGRRRVSAQRHSGSLAAQLKRGGSGLARGGKLLGGRLVKRQFGRDRAQPDKTAAGEGEGSAPGSGQQGAGADGERRDQERRGK